MSDIHTFKPSASNGRFCETCEHHISNPVHSVNDPLVVAQFELRPHSLIGTRRTWQRLAVVCGVAGWGYAYEGGNFESEADRCNRENAERVSSPAYRKTAAKVTRAERSIRKQVNN